MEFSKNIPGIYLQEGREKRERIEKQRKRVENKQTKKQHGRFRLNISIIKGNILKITNYRQRTNE